MLEAIKPVNQFRLFSFKSHIALAAFTILLCIPALVKAAPLEYCEAEANRPWNAWISGVEFAGINHDLNKKNKYAYFLDDTAFVQSGATEQITVTSSLSWITEVLHYKVWIDFNQDGVFDDANEAVAYIVNPETIYGAPTDIMQASINIPTSAVSGDTRMRISMAWNEEPSPCGVHESGEVNDFNITIESGNGTPANLSPTAVLSTSATMGTAPLSISLDASASSDVDGSISSVSWDLGDGNSADGFAYDYTYIEPGNYTVTLEVVDDLGASATETVEITVIANTPNQTPIATINANSLSGLAPLTVNFDASDSADSDGTIIDYSWTLGNGESANSIETSTTFSDPGTYQVVLTVTDNTGATGSATITVNVIDSNDPVTTVSVAIAQGSDDAEEKPDGSTNLSSSDLEMVEERETQIVGLRFANTPVPAGATIVSAWIQFTADEDDDEPTSLIIRGEKNSHSFTFDHQDHFISSRTRTTNSITWNPDAWDAPDSGNAQKPPNLASIVQEIITLPGWQSSNAVSFIIEGSGKRVAVSRNNDREKAAVLHIQYRGGESSNAPTNLSRGPYLQTLTTNSVIVRWRTDSPGTSTVKYGKTETNLDLTANSSSPTQEHEIHVTALEPDTRYYYQIESNDESLMSSLGYFETAPLTGSTDPVRIWVIGDAGRANFAQESVYSAYLDFTGSTHTDAWLMLGDNAYGDGSDDEYQNAVFDIYPELLSTTALWPAFGNHDAHSSTANDESGPYYDMFNLPTQAEAGGIASGREAYYSYDYGNIHFVNLNSAPNGNTYLQEMIDWLEQDLTHNTQTWTIAYMHHPPYSKGSHDSDTANTLINLREQVVPVLEAHGVDMLLTGHSHSYERSFLINGHYGLSSTFDNSMLMSGHQNEYQKSAENTANSGTIYAVAGASGSLNNAPLGHPIMAYDEVKLGSMVIDVNGLELRSRYIDNTGEVVDEFTIVKTP